MAWELAAWRRKTFLASIEVYLTVANGLEAIAFYEKAFGAKVVYKELTPDGRPAACDAGGVRRPLHAVGLLPRIHHRRGAARPSDAKGSMAVQINLQNPLEVDGAIARAVAAAGATVTMPASDTFWVMRYGRMRDPYGYVWAFGAPLPLGTLNGDTGRGRFRSDRHRRRARRLCVRHPRQPARHEGRDGREARNARRHLPQRRLHPLEGDAACVRALRGGGQRTSAPWAST